LHPVVVGLKWSDAVELGCPEKILEEGDRLLQVGDSEADVICVAYPLTRHVNLA
jgi:hypothetical protein